MKKLIMSIVNINENPAAIRLRYAATAPIGSFLVWLGVYPTHLNLLGLISGLTAGVLIGTKNLPWAAGLFLVSLLCDGLDGVVARARGLESVFGVFFDSVCDRYVDTAVLLGIAWYFMAHEQPLYVLVTFSTVIGTVATSYARARAESLSLSSRYVGFLNRPERVILLFIGLLIPQTLLVISWLLAVLSNVTAIHRIVFYIRDAQRIATPKPID